MTSDDPALHYLPPGWTEEKYKNATDEDFEDLPDDVLERNMARMAAEARITAAKNLAEINARRAARGAPSIEESRALRSGVHPLVTHVESKGWDDFGFMIFRTDYSDDARWDRFVEEYDPILTGELDRAAEQRGSDGSSTNGVDRIKDKLFMKICDDEILSGPIGPRDVARAFQMFKEEDEVEPGLDIKMCLMVDAECIASLLDRGSSTAVPFVKAVDVRLDSSAGQACLDRGYQGWFKVSIASLVMEFYLALHEFGTPQELAPFARPIWQDRL